MTRHMMNMARLNFSAFIFVTAIGLIGHCGLSAAATNTGSRALPSGESLLQLRNSLDKRMASSPFNIPLLIESIESTEIIQGDVYAELKHSFATVSAALASPQAWCDILILHLNTKSCALQLDASNPAGTPTLLIRAGKKEEQKESETYPIAFIWKPSIRKADYLQVNLSANTGPLGTRDYRIKLEATPTPSGHTFIHLSYSYGFGGSAKFLMKAYLNTLARSKVGFTIIGTEPTGKRIYVDGLLGLVERNVMRYHLAVEAYLGALQVSKPLQFEKRINDWFSATERYPQQLHEIERSQYLQMKRREFRNGAAPV